MVRISQQTSRGLSLSPEQVTDVLSQEDAHGLAAAADGPAHGSPGANSRKKLLRRLRSRWGLHYGTLMQRAAVAPHDQRDRVLAAVL